ncbi:dTMP kinase [Calidifontibacter terrae]
MSPTTAAADGVFVVFEGGDGAGKSTQIEALVTALRAEGRSVVTTREPGGTPLGQQIRALVLHGDDVDPRAEALLFAADRAHHIATLVRPALTRGDVVVQDRYLDSSIAYQGHGRDLDPSDIRRLSQWATRDLRPDLTIVLDLDPAIGRERRGDTHDRLESEGDDFHARVRGQFLALAQAEPDRYLVIDATLPRERIAALIADAVTALTGGHR